MTHTTYSRTSPADPAHPPTLAALRSQTPVVRRALLCVAAGLLVGALTSYGQTYLSAPWEALTNSASAWLLAPFAVGAFSRSLRLAAVAGGATCLAQLIGYDMTSDLRGFAAGTGVNVFWALCAVFGGPLFGVAGEAWRHASDWHSTLAAAALPGAFLGEGLIVYALKLHAGSTAALWVAIAIALTLLLNRDGTKELKWIAATSGTACVCEILLSAVYAQGL